MPRPCFLIVDREYAGSLSTRKLVIETAKSNVITAYSGREAIETLARFPAVDAMVVDAGMSDMPCTEVVTALKQRQPKVPVIVIGTPSSRACDGADHYLDSFEPGKLLGLLASIVPRVAAVKAEDERRAVEGGSSA